jgi:hypothetical protein
MIKIDERYIDDISKNLNIVKDESKKIIEKALAGNEINENFDTYTWLTERFYPNCVFIDEDGYSRMCIDALKILGSTAATDYGSSRQRDLGQLWADMTRGYLGEYAFRVFLKQKFSLDSQLGHDKGDLSDFLPTDIHLIRENSGEYRVPKLKIGIKTTKWNGIWLDIPGEQFNHSDIHILIKVGTGRDHLFSFFKKISVFQDKVLKIGKDIGALTESESEEIYNNIPTFQPIASYVCGFADKNKKYFDLSYGGKKGTKNYTINSWNGPIKPGDLEKIKVKEKIAGKVTFEGIGEFAHDKGFLYNTGSLLWKKEDWDKVIQKL